MRVWTSLRKTYANSIAKPMLGSPREPQKQRRWDKTVLASQFVAGLRPHLQAKVVGMEGGLDQLVLKARFEEAKSKELTAARPGAATKPNKGSAPSGGTSSGAPRKGDQGSNRQTQRTQLTDKCFNCGHYARDCSYPKQNRRVVEARGKKRATVTNIQEAEENSEKEMEQLRQRLRELEMKTALKRVASMEGDDESRLGPTVFVDVEVNGMKTTALRDADPGEPEGPQHSC